jgi:diamine N-acetyltransferase
MDRIDIRAATASDHEVFAALNRGVQDVHVQARPDLFRPSESVQRSASEFAEMLVRPGVVVWLACRGETTLGCLHAERQERPESAVARPQVVLYIHAMAVRPDARGCGCGTQLLLHALAFARTAGVTRVELDVWSFNAGAQRLYRRLGFTSLIERMALEV